MPRQPRHNTYIICGSRPSFVLYRGFREKKRRAAKYPRLYGPLTTELSMQKQKTKNEEVRIEICARF